MRNFVLLGGLVLAASFAVTAITGGTSPALLAAAALTVVLGMGHSLLGERYMLRPLFRLEGLPVILGSVEQTRGVLRLAWHVTSLAWWGLATMMAYMYFVANAVSLPFLWITAAVFGASGIASLAASKGKHKSWAFFFAIAALNSWAALNG